MAAPAAAAEPTLYRVTTPTYCAGLIVRQGTNPQVDPGQTHCPGNHSMEQQEPLVGATSMSQVKATSEPQAKAGPEPCPTCFNPQVPRSPQGRILWTPTFIQWLEAQHHTQGRSYKWLAQKLKLSYSTLSAQLYHARHGGVPKAPNTYQGSPCRREGHTLRYTKGGQCVMCEKQRQLRPAKRSATTQIQEQIQ